MGNYGSRGAVLVIGGTAVLHAVWASCATCSLQGLDQARFANPCFTAEQYHLARAVLDLRPALQEHGHFCSRPTSGVSPRALVTSRRLCAPLSPRTR